MNGLFYAHSGLRYLVLLVALAGLAMSIRGQLSNAPVPKAARIVGSIYSGLVDLQVLLGLIMVGLGRWYPMLAGHLVLMVLALVATHVLFVRARKAATPSWRAHLFAYGLSLGLILAGVFALGRMPWATSAMKPLGG